MREFVLKDNMKHFIELLNIFLIACCLSHTLGICWYLLGNYELKKGMTGNWIEFFDHVGAPW